MSEIREAIEKSIKVMKDVHLSVLSLQIELRKMTRTLMIVNIVNVLTLMILVYIFIVS